MTLKELNLICNTPIKAESGFNGKVLCKRYIPKKHEKLLGDREVVAIWSEINVQNGIGYTSCATPVVCVCLHGDVEAEATWEAQKGGEGSA